MRIGWTDYRIDLELTTEQLSQMGNQEGAIIGRCHFAEKTIYVASDISKTDQKLTLCHEIVEAMNYHYTIGLTHHWKVDRLERALFEFLNEVGFDFNRLLPQYFDEDDSTD